MNGRVWGGGGGGGATPQPPLRVFLSRARLPESFWLKVLVKTHHASIVFANGGGATPAV